MTQITVLGPNLRDQSKGMFNAHAAGCAHLSTSKFKYAEQDTNDYDSRREVVEDLYPPDQFEWSDGPDDASYWDDVYFAPCLKSFPKES